jgi:hypothetical protein
MCCCARANEGVFVETDLASAKSNAGPEVVVIGHDRAENTGPIYAALDRAGCRVLGTTERVDGLDLASLAPTVVVVRGDMVPRGQDVDLINRLKPIEGRPPWKLVVLLGRNRSERAAALKLAHVDRVVVVPPYDFGFLNPSAQQVAPASTVTTPTPQSSATAAKAFSVNPALSPTPVKRRVRLAFYGSRGGVGVSTAALKVAQWLAEGGMRVILIDATGRGDLHLMLGLEPDTARHTQGNLTLWLGQPSEDAVAGYDALVIDGGRQAGTFNARWVELRKPLKDDELQSLVRLSTKNAGSAPRTFSLGRVLSVRITE